MTPPTTALPTRPLGASGLSITPVGFGAWAIGGGDWAFGWGPQDDEQSIAAMRHAVERGINWIDTAAVYGLGHSEEVVGRLLRGLPANRRPLVFTKCGMVWDELGPQAEVRRVLTPDSIRAECDASLRRLGVERIDLYQIHWPDVDTGARLEDSWSTMAELVDEGKARWIGVSNFTVDLLERCESIRHVDSVQPPLSMVQRGALTDVIPWASEHGTGAIVYSPMASGLLTGSFDRARLENLAADDMRRNRPEYQEPALSQNLELVERLRGIADELECEVAEVAIAWALAQGGVTGAIVGARRPAQLDQWIGAGSVQLSDEQLDEIDAAIAETGAGTEELPTPPRPTRT
jgi:aryl-alcohol dehydrogenase-like predicted oxidoreductase